MIAGYREFEFDLPDALLKNLVSILDNITKAPLRDAEVSEIPDEQGVYQLFLDDTPVYVGKTDADAGLLKRLTRHSKKILHRSGLDPARVSFKAVRIYVFTAVDLETDLIKHYGGTTGLAWNGSGFGSNDPGRERDTTNNKPENFDYQFPIDIDRPLDVSLPSSGTAAALLGLLREKLPYTIRAQRPSRSRRLHADLETTTITGLSALTTTRAILKQITSQLPTGWQATKLLGYIILYKESKAYPQSEIIATG